MKVGVVTSWEIIIASLGSKRLQANHIATNQQSVS